MINITQISSPLALALPPSGQKEIISLEVQQKLNLKNSLIDKGILNSNFIIQDTANFPPPAHKQLIFEPLQKFLKLEIDYNFLVDEAILAKTEIKLIKTATNDTEKFEIQKFLNSIKSKVFTAKVSFIEILRLFAEESQDQAIFEMVGGWVLYTLSQSPDIFEKLLRGFLKSNQISYEGSLQPHSYRYRPELDIKIHIKQSVEKLFQENDRLYECFIKHFAIDPVFDLYYYRTLFQQFTLKFSPAFPNTTLGRFDHKLDLLFTSDSPPPLMATDRVTFLLKDKVIFHHYNDRPISHEKFQVLEFKYQDLQSFYQCLINLYFGVDQVNDPAKVNDKAIPRLISRMSLGLYFPQDELSYLLNNNLKERSLETLFIDYHLNHHEGNDELLMGFLLNSFLAFKKLHYAFDLAQFWEQIKSHIQLCNLRHPLLKSSFTLLCSHPSLDLLEKLVQYYGLFSQHCKTTIEEFEQVNILKIAVNETINVFIPSIGIEKMINLADDLENLPQEITFTETASTSPLQTPLVLNADQAALLVKKLAQLCRTENGRTRTFYKNICQTVDHELLKTFAKKIFSENLSEEFIKHFIVDESSYPLAFQLYQELGQDKQNKLYNLLLGLLVRSNFRQAIQFIHDAIDSQLMNRSQLDRIFKFYNQSHHQTKYLFFKFCETLIPKLDTVPGDRQFFNRYSHLIIDYIKSDKHHGIRLYHRIKEAGELSEESLKDIHSKIDDLSDQIASLEKEYRGLKSEELADFQKKLETSLIDRFLFMAYESPEEIIQFFVFFAKNGLFSFQLFNFFLNTLKNADLKKLNLELLLPVFLNSLAKDDKEKFVSLGDRHLELFNHWISQDLSNIPEIAKNLYRNKVLSKKNLEFILANCLENITSFSFLNLAYLTSILNLIIEFKLNINPSHLIDLTLDQQTFKQTSFKIDSFKEILDLAVQLPQVKSTSLDLLLATQLLQLFTNGNLEEFNQTLKTYWKVLSFKNINKLTTQFFLAILDTTQLEHFAREVHLFQSLKILPLLKESNRKKIYLKLKGLPDHVLLANLSHLLQPSLKACFLHLEKEYIMLLLYLCEKQDPFQLETYLKYFQREGLIQNNQIVYEFFTEKLQISYQTLQNNTLLFEYLAKTKSYTLILNFLHHLSKTSLDLNPYTKYFEIILKEHSLIVKNPKSILESVFQLQKSIDLTPQFVEALNVFLSVIPLQKDEKLQKIYSKVFNLLLDYHIENTPLEVFLKNKTFNMKIFEVPQLSLEDQEIICKKIYNYFLTKKNENPKLKEMILEAGLPLLIQLGLQNLQNLKVVFDIFTGFQSANLYLFKNLLEKMDHHYDQVVGFSDIQVYLEAFLNLESTRNKEGFRKIQQLIWLCDFLLRKTDCKDVFLISRFFNFISQSLEHSLPLPAERKEIIIQLAQLCRTLKDKADDVLFTNFVLNLNISQVGKLQYHLISSQIIVRAINLISKDSSVNYYKKVAELTSCYIEERKFQYAKDLSAPSEWAGNTLSQLIWTILSSRRHFIEDKTINLTCLMKHLLLEEKIECGLVLIFINTYFSIPEVLALHELLFSFFKNTQTGHSIEHSALTVLINRLIQHQRKQELKLWFEDNSCVVSFPELFMGKIFEVYNKFPDIFTLEIVRSFIFNHKRFLVTIPHADVIINQSLRLLAASPGRGFSCYLFTLNALIDFSFASDIEKNLEKIGQKLLVEKKTSEKNLEAFFNIENVYKILNNEFINVKVTLPGNISTLRNILEHLKIKSIQHFHKTSSEHIFQKFQPHGQAEKINVQNYLEIYNFYTLKLDQFTHFLKAEAKQKYLDAVYEILKNFSKIDLSDSLDIHQAFILTYEILLVNFMRQSTDFGKKGELFQPLFDQIMRIADPACREIHQKMIEERWDEWILNDIIPKAKITDRSLESLDQETFIEVYRTAYQALLESYQDLESEAAANFLIEVESFLFSVTGLTGWPETSKSTDLLLAAEIFTTLLVEIDDDGVVADIIVRLRDLLENMKSHPQYEIHKHIYDTFLL